MVATPVATSANKTPAATPKRESPATIAAKEAPGWEKFLGVKSQTVSFTSEEATKFRAARDESRSRLSGNKKAEIQMRFSGNVKRLINIRIFHKGKRALGLQKSRAFVEI